MQRKLVKKAVRKAAVKVEPGTGKVKAIEETVEVKEEEKTAVKLEQS